ncbi:GGDEF domain-containing protein [Vibrio sp. S17_S38]|uniref:GGDEF domain-containing protein n=1 Tax=Vibrio sp. S17_S38 TaxID=2720229 RepID=UPI0016814A82|nr:GGDEF domain-containing protein [Vibrio sp. S17_S38]MBD1573831.1 GGDEF domain-containing protein [Vibrio sp. S17_S38]
MSSENIVNKSILLVVILNIFITAIYLLFNDQKSLLITPEKYVYSVATDQALGGRSLASIHSEKDTTTMFCELNNSENYRWPYCELTIHLSDNIKNGLDLSLYSSVILDVDYRGPESGSQKIRVNLRNFEEDIFNPDDNNTIKYNGIEYAPGLHQGARIVDFGKFQVLTWWLFDYNIDLEHSGVKLNNVPFLQIATDSGSEAGLHQITINKIMFIGNYIRRSTFAFILLFTWIVGAIFLFVYQRTSARVEIEKMEARTKSLALMNQRLSLRCNEIEEMATKDQLTGAVNRHGIKDWLDNIARRVRWGLDSVSIIYVDLDNFKFINDQFGHQVGDEILRQFVDLTRSELRDSDNLVRWGGEEFIIFCSGSNIHIAARIAERIRMTIENHQWEMAVKLTCSFGVTELVAGERVTEMIARADEALYQAKNNGRNRVETLEKLTISPR